MAKFSKGWIGLGTFKQHVDLASERFQAAEEQFEEEKFHTASHLLINAAINYHNAICQKFLLKIPGRKQHSDMGYFHELSGFLGKDFEKYQDAYEFLMAHKSQADYGVGLSANTAKQILRRAATIKEITECLV